MKNSFDIDVTKYWLFITSFLFLRCVFFEGYAA